MQYQEQRGKIYMTMTAQRFEQIVTAYGSKPARWPSAEREAALLYRANHASAQRQLVEFQELDALLDAVPVPALDQMERRIQHSLRKIARGNLLDSALEWLLPRRNLGMAWAWRPALLACLPLICGIYMANFYSFGIDNVENSWQEELYLISMNDYAEITE